MKKVSMHVSVIIAVLFAVAVTTSMAEQADTPAAKLAVAHKAEKPARPAITGKLNINTATAEQIALLPGIGEAKAKAILDYKTTNGNFKKIDDLQNIKGIKEKKVAQIKDYIIFEGETTLKEIK
jgi:competence protein ComEA